MIKPGLRDRLNPGWRDKIEPDSKWHSGQGSNPRLEPFLGFMFKPGLKYTE